MRILFWGTPAYAVPSLDALMAAGHELVGVVSQPDRRRGRGGATMASPVKERALSLGLPVVTPARIRREPDTQAALAAPLEAAGFGSWCCCCTGSGATLDPAAAPL